MWMSYAWQSNNARTTTSARTSLVSRSPKWDPIESTQVFSKSTSTMASIPWPSSPLNLHWSRPSKTRTTYLLTRLSCSSDARARRRLSSRSRNTRKRSSTRTKVKSWQKVISWAYLDSASKTQPLLWAFRATMTSKWENLSYSSRSRFRWLICWAFGTTPQKLIAIRLETRR